MPEQLPIPYIPRDLNGEVISQRQEDGFINATAMCKAANKLFADYTRQNNVSAFLNELCSDMGYHITEVIQSVRGGPPALQGTWVHPQVAVHLAQWLSPKFAVLVSKWVFEWLSSDRFQKPASLPYHLRRYVANSQQVPAGHFSVLNELAIALIAPMEIRGYTIPEKMWPDISQGKMFAKWLRDEKGIDTAHLPTYTHVFEDGRPAVQAKAYPNELLADFRRHYQEVWLPQRAVAYFKERDPMAVEHIQGLLLPPAPPTQPSGLLKQ